MKKQLLFTAAILMGSASYGYADTTNVNPMPFATMDKNGDGFLTKDEVGRRLADRFEQLDIDKSGSLSANELPMLGQGWKGKGQKGPRFAQMDKNGDGVLTKDEVGMRLADRFEQLDTDKSGSLSATELPMQGQGWKGKGQKGPRFAQMDKNGDGFLTKDEMGGRLANCFEQFDRDANGKISADEMPMHHYAKGGKHFAKYHKRPTFAELDTDKNGSLSESEFAAQARGRLGNMQNRPTFEQMDKNGDGVLAKDELRGRLLERLPQLDKDGSGTLSKDEIPRFQK